VNQPEVREDFQMLPLRYAYPFLAEKGLESAASEVRQLQGRSRDRRARALQILESHDLLSGLRIYRTESGIEGVEFFVDSNHRIDILAIDKDNVPVVIELKVSRGYQRVIGQCLFYRNRIKKILNAPRVRVIIVARTLAPELAVAVEDLPDVELYEYELSVSLKRKP